MSIHKLARPLALTAYLIGPSLLAQERDISVSEVPAAALAAAQAAVAGLSVTSAEVETEDGRDVYELEGTADGTEYEIEVTAEGEVLEIEVDD